MFYLNGKLNIEVSVIEKEVCCGLIELLGIVIDNKSQKCHLALLQMYALFNTLCPTGNLYVHLLILIESWLFIVFSTSRE